MLQDFLKTLRDLKWDVDEDAGFGTTRATFENPDVGQGSATLVVTEEKTTLVCKPGSVQRDDLCGRFLILFCILMLYASRFAK